MLHAARPIRFASTLIVLITHPSPAFPPSAHQVWKLVSPEVKDLITKLMHKDPAQRPTISQALHHPWMEKAPMEFSSRPLDDTMKQLKRFNAKRKLMKHVRTVIAANRFKNILLNLGVARKELSGEAPAAAGASAAPPIPPASAGN